jgi:hypothetical protein
MKSRLDAREQAARRVVAPPPVVILLGAGPRWQRSAA